MYANPHPGRFIVFEGLDGSGQSTQVKMLADWLRARGNEIVATKEPTSESEPGRESLEVIAHRRITTPEHLQELISADRAIHLANVIVPALEAGAIVISDRYFMSTLAFGSITSDLAWLQKLNEDFLYPDLVILLRVRPDVSLARIKVRGKEIELFEKREKLEKIAVQYDKLMAMYEGCVVIDGEQPIEAVHREVRAAVIPALQLHRRTTGNNELIL